MVTISYSLTREDYVNYYTYVLWDAPEKKKKRMLGYLKQAVPVVIFTLVLYFTGILQRSNTFTLVILGFIIITSLLSLAGIRSNTVKEAQKFAAEPLNSSFFLETTLTVSESGLITRDELLESRYKWNAFVRKLENDKYYFLFTSTVQAVIIPKKVLAADEKKYIDKLLSQQLSIDAELGHLVKS